MASYHSSFTYLNKNSADQGLIIAAFEPDDGFTDTFLGMDQVLEDYYDGTKKFLYGTKYNNVATIRVVLIKADGTDWTINDNRSALRWLTGSRVASWLDFYQGDKIKYSFLGTVTSSEQYKMDGRIIGISFDFTSITPWAYSQEQVFDRSIKQALLVDDNGVLIKDPVDEISISEDGILCNGAVAGVGACFCVDDDGVLYVKDVIVARIENETDDLHSYIYLDVEYLNDSCKYLEIKNETLDEITRVDDLQPKDIIYITNKQFITAYTQDQITGELVNQNRIFGDSFNFVWPRLAPGVNNLVIEGNGNGAVKFVYRYPMKVGDCAMNISTYGGDIVCCGSDEIPSYDTVRWQDITGTPTTIGGYGITDAYTITEVDTTIGNKADKATTLYGYGITDAYTKSEVYNKDEVYSNDAVYTKDEVYTKTEVDDKIDDIEISGGTGSGSTTIDEEELNSMLGDILA